jgi:hypothetical protein
MVLDVAIDVASYLLVAALQPQKRTKAEYL